MAIITRTAVFLWCILMLASPVLARGLQCVPYARDVSGIAIRGNAFTWWDQAAGRYDRGQAPRVGAVLAFSSVAGMRNGHVAMVSAVVSEREVLLDHANWSRRGGIERGVRAVDVSEAGDWSRVRVWFGPIGGLGRTAYPTKGFIYRDAPEVAPVESTDIARAATGPSDPRGISTLVAIDL
ncbi:MAG: CHAP domain-containing protein [Sphingomonas sp.]|nr:CHAP domain-containing protein [Sphingomonas sp.]